MKSLLSKPKNHKKLYAIIGGIIAVLLIVIYVLFSIYSWQSLAKDRSEKYNQLQNLTDKALTFSIKNPTEKAKKLLTLEDLNTTIGKELSRCDVGFLLSWQQLFPSYKQEIDACQKNSDNLSLFKQRLVAVVAYLKNEQTVGEIITKAASTKQDTAQDDWPGIIKQWEDATKSLRQLGVEKSFSPTKDLAVQKVGSIEETWKSLASANQAKDRAKYEEAVSSLSKAYDELNAVSQSSEKGLQAHVGELEAAYRQTF